MKNPDYFFSRMDYSFFTPVMSEKDDHTICNAKQGQTTASSREFNVGPNTLAETNM